MHPFSVQDIRAFVPELRRDYRSAVVVPGVFSASQCRRIVASASELPVDDALIAASPTDAESDEAVRRARIGWIPAEEPYTWIHDKLAGAVRRANRHYGFDLIGFTEELQFTEYEGAGAFYDWHQDGLDGDLAVRKLSLVVQLSDAGDYDGGDLELFGLHGGDDGAPERRFEMRQQGTVIAFPAFEFHRVTPVRSGTRRSLVCWVGGPPFR